MTKKKETKKMSKHDCWHDQWNVLISSLEVEIRYGVERGTYVDPRPYVSVLRTMEKLGAKRGDSLGHLIDEIGEDVFSAECDKTHREWKEYERLGRLFAPHLDQHRRIKYPNPKEDFHAAWVKAGEDNA